MKLHRLTRMVPITLGLCAAGTLSAQRPSLNLQFHGYATGTYIDSSNNNWNTTNSTGDGSFRWTEGVANVSSQPAARLRLGAQGRFFLLGQYGPKVILDWASVEYKFNERIGVRGGKVKTPAGLFNDTQDIDPAFLWTLLPQSTYPIASRTSNLAVRGGLVFGTLPIGERFGKLEYRAYGGARSVSSDDGYFEPTRSVGLLFPNGVSGRAIGGNLLWRTPLSGLAVGAAYWIDQLSGDTKAGPLTGHASANPSSTVWSSRYEHKRFMAAGEYSRTPLTPAIQWVGIPTTVYIHEDLRAFYVMTSYKLASKLSGGAYYSSVVDRKMALGPGRFQKDWTISAKYDLNSFVYFKAEQHFLDGTFVGFSSANNPNGLQRDSRLTFAKLGVTF